MSSHDLNIERGRFNNPIIPKNQQRCTRCESNEIDDEIHLLLHCSAMNNVREILFDSVAAIIDIQPTNEMLLRIMTSRDITVVKSLAQFIYGCFKHSIINLSPVAILFTCSCPHDLTWVFSHIRTVVALGSYYLFFLGPVRDVSVAFVIRRGGALLSISEMLSQLIFPMRSGMFFFDCNSEYVVLTRS